MEKNELIKKGNTKRNHEKWVLVAFPLTKEKKIPN